VHVYYYNIHIDRYRVHTWRTVAAVISQSIDRSSPISDHPPARRWFTPRTRYTAVWSIRVLLTRCGGGLLCVQRRKAATDTSQYIIIKDSKGERKDLCTTVWVCLCVCVCTRSTTFTLTLVRCTRWFSARLCIGSLTTGRVRNRYTKRALDKTKRHTCLLCRHCICAGRPSIISSYFSNIINNNMYYYCVHICVYRGRASESDKRSVEGRSYLIVTPVTGVQYTAAAVV